MSLVFLAELKMIQYPSAHTLAWSPRMSGQLSLKEGISQSTMLSIDYKMLSQLPRRISAHFSTIRAGMITHYNMLAREIIMCNI